MPKARHATGGNEVTAPIWRVYYQDDFVTIINGDCRERMAPEWAFDAIVTDPPYGIGWNTEGGGIRSQARTQRGVSFGAIHGDNEAFDPAPWLALNRPTVLFGANHYADKLPPSPSWFVWDKRVHMASTDQADCEFAWTNLGGPARIFRLVWNGGASPVADERTYGGSPVANHHRPFHTVHPTQKPVRLMRWVLERVPGEVILDPYMGIGSTLVAAKSLNRKAIGIEIEERYCEIAARRCSQEVLGLAG